MDDIEIIENTEQARNEYTHWWGSSEIVLTVEHIKALKEGKCLGTNDGEYAHFITLKE